MKLSELRERWEKGCTVVLTVPIYKDDYRKLLVVVKSRGMYVLYRYFQIGVDWQVSQDMESDDVRECLASFEMDDDKNDLPNLSDW